MKPSIRAGFSYCLNYISKLITTSFKWLAVNFFITRASKEPFIFWFYFNEFFFIDKAKLVTRNKYLISLRKKKKFSVKVALSGLRQFSAAESPLKMMKNTFYFTSKSLFVLKIFFFSLTFWSFSKTAWLER